MPKAEYMTYDQRRLESMNPQGRRLAELHQDMLEKSTMPVKIPFTYPENLLEDTDG